MVDAELAILQKELDEKKYRQSELAKTDLSGRMDYCKDCTFNQFDITVQHNKCFLDSRSRAENLVCAKNKVKQTRQMK